MKKYIKIISLILVIILVGCGTNTKTEEVKEEPKNGEKQVLGCSNVGNFILYNDNIYYWKLNSSSRSESALFGSYKDIKDSINELVKVDSNGNEEVILKGNGSKELVICNDTIYTSFGNDEYENSRTIYSINIDGTNKQEIGIGIIENIIGSNIIGSKDEYSDGIFSIDTATNKYFDLKDNAKLLLVDNDTIYYSSNDNEKNLIIGTIKDNEDNGGLITISSTDFDNQVTVLDVEKINILDDKIEIYIGYRDGSANTIQELIKYTMNKDGSNLQKIEVTNSMDEVDLNEYSQVYIDGDNIIYIDSNNNKNNIVSIDNIYSKYNLDKNEETNIYLYKGNIVGDNVYFILDYTVHDSINDIGWRYSYKRLKTIYLKYNIKDKTLDNIYEF